MMRSTITEKFQTTIPREVREALQLKPRQRLSYELCTDGSVVVRPELALDELFGSVKLRRPVASTRGEKRSARKAMASEAAGEGNP